MPRILTSFILLLGLYASGQDCTLFQNNVQFVDCGEGLTLSPNHIVNGHSMHLNGTTAYLHCTETDELDMVDEDFSLSVWIKPGSNVGRQNIICDPSSTWASHGAYTLYLEDGFLRFTIRFSEGSPWSRHLITVPVALDTWQHVVAVGDRHAGEMRLYLDGSLVGSMDWNGVMYKDTALPMLIGVQHKEDWPGKYFAFFQGELDDIMIIDRVLEPSEIEALALCPGTIMNDEHLRTYWDFEESNGQWTMDETGTQPQRLILLNSAFW